MTPTAQGVDIFHDPGPFTTAELAAACRCSVRFVQKAIEAGALASVRLGRVYRVPASAARKFAADLGAEPANLSDEVRDMREVRQVREARDIRIVGRG